MSTKGKIVDIKHFAVHDGPGIRTTVFVKGCTLKCVWCHNPESINPKPELGVLSNKCMLCGNCATVCDCHRFIDGKHIFDRERCKACGRCVSACYFDALVFYGKTVTPEELMPELLEDRVFYKTTGGGITVSGGEPLMQADFTAELLALAGKNGLHCAVDTCGNAPWQAFEKVLPYTDLFLYDFKHPQTEGHKRCTGCGNERIIENLRKLDQTGKPIEIRMPLIPGWNASAEWMEESAQILGELKHLRGVKLLSYHAFSHSKYAAVGHPDTMPDAPSPDEAMLAEYAQPLRRHSIHVL